MAAVSNRGPEDRSRELAALSNHLQALSEREKSELARKLHDELGGLLTAAKMDLSWLQSRLEGAAIQERLAQLGGVLDEAMDLKRRVVEELRPSLLDHFGLPTALRAYVESTCAQGGTAALTITIEHDLRVDVEGSGHRVVPRRAGRAVQHHAACARATR